MKFRTDFVTNSSNSSFVTFNIKNKRLFEALTGLGIKFRDVKDGEFSNAMKIELPSGETSIIDNDDIVYWSLPYFTDMDSISAWLVASILLEVEYIYPKKEKDEYSDFQRELIDLLNKADITHLDWEAVKTWSREAVVADCEKVFGSMDGDIEEANIELAYSFEQEVGPCLYTEIKDGRRMSASYDAENIPAEAEDCNGLKFVVTGKLKFFKNRDEIVEFIEDAGGSVTEIVSKNTDYLICNDVRSNSSKMKKAKDLGIAVLSEVAFIIKFAAPYYFDDFEFDDYEEYVEYIGEKAVDLTYDGGVLDFAIDYGPEPIVMEIWKEGKWVQNVSDQKATAKKATKAAKNEATKKIMANIWANADGRLKKLLLIPTRDCLSATDAENIAKIESMSFDLLCENGYIRFEIGPIDAFEAQDCYICVEKERKKDIFRDNLYCGDIYSNDLIFTVICKNEIADMEDYRTRHIEICSVLNEMLNGKKSDVFNCMYFKMCKSNAISDNYSSCTIWFNDNSDTYRLTGGVNILGEYATDNEAIVRTLLADTTLMAAMELEEKSEAILYSEGYFKMHESFAQNLNNGYRAWVLIDWNFSHYISVNVVPVCRVEARKMSNGDDRLAVMVERIKASLNGLSMAMGGKLELADKYSQDEINLSDELVAGMIKFNEII